MVVHNHGLPTSGKFCDLENAKQQERLAAERELQKQLAASTKRIAELEAAQKLAADQKKAEVTKLRAELEAELSKEKARANDLARQGKDYPRIVRL